MKKSRILFVAFFAMILGLFLVSCSELPTHVHSVERHEKVEATCTEDGTVFHFECTTCHRCYQDEACEVEIKAKDLVIPATGHTLENIPAVEPTCTKEGNTEHYVCLVCETLFEDETEEVVLEKEDVVVAKVPHTAILVAAVAPECAKEGSIEHHECTVCHKTFTDETCAVELTEEELVVEALGHTMTEHEAVLADCLNAGKVNYFECSVCNKFFADEAGVTELTEEELVVEALGHDLVHYEAVDATCTTVGHNAYDECTRCDYTTYEEIVALGHDLVHHEAVEATCTTAGHNAYDECTRCDYTTYEEIVALGHDLVQHEAVDATCTTAGHNAYDECTRCDYTTYEEIVALGHDLVHHEAVEATCTTAGYNAYDECTRCDYTTYEEIVALGHTMTEHEEVVPTFDASGTAQYFECSTCNKLFLDQEGTIETTIDELVRYAYLVTKNDAATAGYYISYRESHTFIDESNTGVFVSDNKGMNSTTSYMDIYFTSSGYVTFNYEVSSEARWDKLNIWAQSDGEGYRQILTDASGEASGSFKLFVEAGDHVFFQYSKDSSGNKNNDIATISNMVFVTADLYEKSTLTFESNGGNDVEAISAYNNVAIVAPANPAKEGYFFDGWFRDAEFTTLFNFAAGLNGNLTVYAKYTKGVTVTFENTGDTAVESVLVRPNAEIEVPSVVPTTATQYFKGWFSDAIATVEFDFAAGVAVDTVVYAGWRNPVVLSFDSNEGSEVEAIATDINVALTAPTNPTKDNHKFAGWYVDAEFTTLFDFAQGITEDTLVYAKWLAQVEVTYMNGSVVVGSEFVDNGSEFTPSNPADFDEIVEGWYVDAELTNEFVDGTVLENNIVLYAKLHTFAPEGVLTSMANGDGSSAKNYPWNYDLASNTFTSSNHAVGSSISTISFTFAKESFVSFDYLVNSESNYDYIKVLVNNTQVLSTRVSAMNGVDVTGSYSHVFQAGDVLTIQYTKDGSGNQGADQAVISNLIINDGVPSVSVTFNYQEDGVADVVVSLGINSVLSEMENFAAYAPEDTDARHFGGWYYDAECTNAVKDTDTVLQNVIVYAKYLYPATITFDTDGAGEIAPISVWTGVAIENMPVAPIKAGYIFRYWMDENAQEFVPANGVTGDLFLTAYFEELPVGATVDEALVVEFVDGKYESGTLRTNEEFQNFYVLFTPEVTDIYYFYFESGNVTIEGGKVTYSSYRRYNIKDTDGNNVLSATSSNSNVVLEAGKTYVITYNLGSGSNTAWGTFTTEIYAFAHDYALTESIDYTFGETVTLLPGTFVARDEEIIYKLVAEQSGTFAAHIATDDWANISIYSDVELKNRVSYKNVSATSGMKDEVVDLVMEVGKTYYIVLSHNWTITECAENTMAFRVVEYPQGYAQNNPFTYTLGETINATFDEGANSYYQVEITEAGTYKLDILSISDTNSKTVDLYNVNDLTTKVATLAGAEVCEYYVEALEAGTYIIKVYNTSTSYKTSFTASLSQVEVGGYWTTADELTIAEAMTVNANAEGYYYQFTTGEEKLWYFFTPSVGSVKVYDSARKELGSTAVQLEANTAYFFVVTADAETVDVAHNTLVEYADGKTPNGAFTYSDETKTLNTDQTSHTVYFKYTAQADGTYRFYTNNAGSIDPRGYLYSDADFSTMLKSNGDGGSTRVNEGVTGYKYDFYFEADLVAGQTYYVKVTYTVYAVNKGIAMYLGIDMI